MQTLQIGVQTRSLGQPLKKALRTAAQLGANGVEIDLRTELPPAELSQTALREIRRLLENLGLRVSAAAFPTRGGYGEAENLDRRVQATAQALQAAYQLGTNVVVNRVGPIPEDTTDPAFGRLVESLTLIGATGERVGARLAAQAGADGGAELATLLDALPAEAIGVDLHPASLIVNGHDVAETIDQIGSSVVHVHACDAVRDFALGRSVEVELGRGTADLPEILGRLEEYNYQGWVTIERRDAADPVSDVANAVAYLRALGG